MKKEWRIVSLNLFQINLFVSFKHTLFRSPRHLAVVYMYIIMFDM